MRDDSAGRTTAADPGGSAAGARPSPTPADVVRELRQRPAASVPPSTPPGSPTASRVPQERTAPARRRVVVAEDESLIRLDLVETLQELDFEVVGEAGDGERAVELAEQLRPDLVLLDVKMPVLDGISAARRIAEGRIAPVVILTAFSQRELVERAREAGAMAYLVKPFTAADLLPAIEIAVSRYAEMNALEAEIADLAERLEARKAIERAKGLLQIHRAMNEADAFRWIQRAAMDRRVSMRAVAETVIAAADAESAP